MPKQFPLKIQDCGEDILKDIIDICGIDNMSVLTLVAINRMLKELKEAKKKKSEVILNNAIEKILNEIYDLQDAKILTGNERNIPKVSA